MHLQANMTTFSLVEGENLFLLPIFVSFGQLSIFFFHFYDESYIRMSSKNKIVNLRTMKA